MTTKAENRFDYNREETIKLRKEIEEKRKLLLENGLPKSSIIPKVSLRNVVAFFFAIFSMILLRFLNYPEPPLSPIQYQWQNMGKTFNHNGYDIFYIDKINDMANTKETLVILHGFPTSSFDFHLIFPNLTKTFNRVIAPDFIGFGFSSKPRSYEYSLMDQTNLVISLIEKLQLNNVNLLTHDYGDSVAQELLARNQEGKLNFKLNSVVMLNGGIFPSVHMPILSQKLFRIPILRTILSKFSNSVLFGYSINKVFGPYTQASPSEIQDMWKLICLESGYRLWPHLLTYIDERFDNEKRWVNALKTSVPFHFIYGPADPVNPASLFERTFNEIVGKKHLSILPTHIGHYPQIEAVDDVMNAYSSFLETVLRFI